MCDPLKLSDQRKRPDEKVQVKKVSINESENRAKTIESLKQLQY
jgi:hypothetical protein